MKNSSESLRENEDPHAASSICRICLSGNSDEEDPLISPCACSGSMQFVHLKCLQYWIKSKLNILENKNLITVYWKNLNCELCKSPFPFEVQQYGRDYTLVPINIKKMKSYVIMESLSKDKEPTGMHIIDISTTDRIVMVRSNELLQSLIYK